MILDDLEQVLAIEKDAFPDLFPPTSFRSELKRSRSEYFVAYAIKDIEKLEDLETNIGANGEKHLQYRSGYTGWLRGCKFHGGLDVTLDAKELENFCSEKSYTSLEIINWMK